MAPMAFAQNSSAYSPPKTSWGVPDLQGTFSSASLTTLRRLPIQVLKIDKGFIDDIDTSDEGAGHTAAIIRLAREWGYHVVAEGVERESQRDCLLASGCEVIEVFV